jgi:outer membrane protein TolC
VRREVLHDVQTAYENLMTSDRRIFELGDQVRASDEAFQQARNAFLNNPAINLDVLVAQDQLLNAELQLTSAQFDRTVFYLDLVRATGRLHEVAAAGPTTAPTTSPATVPTTTMPTTPFR